MKIEYVVMNVKNLGPVRGFFMRRKLKNEDIFTVLL